MPRQIKNAMHALNKLNV